MTDKTENNSIAFWGPPASGKTSLISAFARELTWYSKADLDFSYKLSYNQGFRSEINTEITPEFPLPTPPSPVDHAFYFERLGKKKDSLPHQVSSFRHTLEIRDNSGENLYFRVLKNDHIVNYDDYHSIRNFIVLVDPTSIVKKPDMSTNRFQFTPEQYLESLQQLLRIGSPESETLRIAICISKSDALHVALPANLILEEIFGNRLIYLLSSNHRVNFSFFKVSSVGMITTISGRSVSNIANLKENPYELRDPEKWNPINVVSPFFWIFENIEREIISKYKKKNIFNFFDIDRQKYYIPYPPPRPI